MKDLVHMYLFGKCNKSCTEWLAEDYNIYTYCNNKIAMNNQDVEMVNIFPLSHLYITDKAKQTIYNLELQCK